MNAAPDAGLSARAINRAGSPMKLTRHDYSEAIA
jgi:hypothetical protein